LGINLASPALPVQLASGLIALGSGVMSIATLAVFLSDWLVTFYERMSIARSVTPQSEFAKQMRGLTEEQSRAVRTQGELTLDVVPELDGTKILVRGTTVPLDFVNEEFLPHCRVEKDVWYLAPISTWSEGFQWQDAGERRKLAKEFTDYLILRGWATPSLGNQPAHLVGRLNLVTLRKALGLFETEG
jgi:hypothetical protein